jgi:activator of 2-hydroxyglutaryl-CoA dehydratase
MKKEKKDKYYIGIDLGGYDGEYNTFTIMDEEANIVYYHQSKNKEEFEFELNKASTYYNVKEENKFREL